MTNSKIEWESSISFRVTEQAFQEFPHEAEDKIFLFDQGFRIAARRVECKTIICKKRVLGFLGTKFFPILRTQALETLSSPPSFDLIKKTIARKISLVGSRVRVVCDSIRSELGAQFKLSGEIEYPENSTLDEIQSFEEELMGVMEGYQHLLQFDEMNLTEICACPSQKLQLWHIFDAQLPYTWALKFNGRKAKMILKEGEMIFWADGCGAVISATDFSCPQLYNLVIQVEELSSSVVIVETLAAKYLGDIYSVELATNQKILHFFGTLSFESVELRLGEPEIQKNLIIQKFNPSPLTSTLDSQASTSTDGFIIFQNPHLIKWKPPTLDVQFQGGNSFLVGSTTLRITNIPPSALPLIKDKIYEVDYRYKLLRLREDRHTPNDEQEYEVFLDSSDRLESFFPQFHGFRSS